MLYLSLYYNISSRRKFFACFCFSSNLAYYDYKTVILSFLDFSICLCLSFYFRIIWVHFWKVFSSLDFSISSWLGFAICIYLYFYYIYYFIITELVYPLFILSYSFSTWFLNYYSSWKSRDLLRSHFLLPWVLLIWLFWSTWIGPADIRLWKAPSPEIVFIKSYLALSTSSLDFF